MRSLSTVPRAAQHLAVVCMAMLAVGCGGLRGEEVTVSLYSGLESPTIRVDRDTYSSIVECLQKADDDPSAAPTGMGIPAFLIEADEVSYVIEHSQTLRDGEVVIIGCEDSFAQLRSEAEGQLEERELGYLDEAS
ncbi:MAG: hypothetical protein ACTIMA_13395 [Brachybacterium tyrofermentans]|uniref:hypothetical protein n=1 Tax=Brachybacterium tyrofermentans TaxID=47848 RepID=UPI000A1B6D05|nr:hypothetical protein [Brachybacterium tyrofermentans]SLN05345.1 hypothetical protein FM103_19860 [Corynebacterium xerosis]